MSGGVGFSDGLAVGVGSIGFQHFNGNISTLAGLSSPLLNGPSSVAVFGNTLYIADPGNHVIRQAPVAGGTVAIFAGTQGLLGFTGDNGAATGARLNRPSGLAVNTDGDVFIADTNNHRIRRVSGGIIGLVVTQGIPRSGFEGDGGLASTARLNSPSAVAVDSGGNLYILDKGNNRIRRVVAATNIINTVIGNGEIGFGGDGFDSGTICNGDGCAFGRIDDWDFDAEQRQTRNYGNGDNLRRRIHSRSICCHSQRRRSHGDAYINDNQQHRG